MKSLAELTRTVRPLVRSASKRLSTDLARNAIQTRAAKLAAAPVAEVNLSVAASPTDANASEVDHLGREGLGVRSWVERPRQMSGLFIKPSRFQCRFLPFVRDRHLTAMAGGLGARARAPSMLVTSRLRRL
jgi:hypothetical protein